MSRTYKTAPYWVQLNKPELTGVVVTEFHDHSTGPCDLPDDPTVHKYQNGTKCHYSYEYNGRNTFCGCDLCTGQSWRKIANKATRRKSNQRRRNFTTDVEFYEELDDYESRFATQW